ncbi:SecD/SecF fusion protein [Fibrobacter sp. UWH9]|uniref:protein translocase subunit SecDF n=1 Tax=unclassified Fibrobacter TaxID=2634177 RepID=UPI000918996A|nr:MULTISPECIES: protein translocase subunit SecDF [Fibrobacter]MCQ2099894.1 protein translocase subunit SecDF [Fibrobacter sp.]MCL4102196.1 Protein translocase subunit SecD [Fibrobacter succinogenes]MDO4946168.1 protein translocase subunit SecDF [Fibrobacter sp.]OWV02866.1 protein translocase subunit SecDF [Fibrobacter sp. UWH3]OWV08833.1 protein translocase subunit SecDF [Fibrobacter sp. UWH1]
MNKNKFGMREFIILLVIILSAYTVWPSIQVHSKSGDEKKTFLKENPKLGAKSINFGLDLAGGTAITLEIEKSGIKNEDIKDVQEQSLEIIRNRVDQYGLSEPQISPSGDDRIVVELAGVDDSTAKALVGSTAKLEFKILAEAEKFQQVVLLIDQYLTRQTTDIAADSAATVDTTAAAAKDSAKDTTKALSDDELLGNTQVAEAAPAAETAETAKAEPASEVGTALSAYYMNFGNGGFIAEESVEKVKKLLATEGVQKLIPRDVNFAFGSGLEPVQRGSQIKAKRLYLLKRRAEMSGDDVVDAQPHRVSDGVSAGEVAVSLKFGGIGPKKFSAVTAANIGKQMAIVLDNQVISAPVIRDRIPNGEAQITGLDDMAEANRLSVVLRAGALKAPMNIIESRSVGATLGEENIVQGFGSGAVGLILCLVFMIGYYRLGGFIASLGMIINTLVTAAVMSVFNATLTLPGIAGFILVLGMSLDANVIIYERIREEIKGGLTARAAVAKGYERAFSAIFDSNLTTVLTALILYKIGTGSVKGFGLTLMIGIITSLFCALTVTRAVFDWKLAKQDATTLSIGGGFKFLNNANLPVVPNRGKFKLVSIIMIVVSIASIAVKGFDFSIDFTGGQVYTVQYQDADKHEGDLNKALADAGIKGAKVRSLGGTSANSYQISMRASEDAQFEVKMAQAFEAANQKVEIVAKDNVGPTIGKELRNDAIMAIILAWIAIGLYVWFRFGKLGLGFGIGAVVGLVHDSLITLGFISLFGLSFDGALIASLLTMIGYSVNDTIVVFDRVRENAAIHGLTGFDKTLNSSINQCFSRTVITSLTTLFVCLVLAIMGGSSIRDFGMVMVFGIFIGTYSSVCICSPFVLWYSKRFKTGV